MTMCRNFRVVGLALGWLWLSLAPVSAQWLFEKKLPAEGSALELARQAPVGAQVMVGFSLPGQVDTLGVVADLREAAQVLLPETRAEVLGFEDELGVPLEEWLDLFTGHGYVALLERQPGEAWSESLVLAVQLKEPILFGQWLDNQLGGDLPQRPVAHGFVVRQLTDRTQFALGNGWFVIASNRATADRTLAALSQTGKTLDSEARFVRAKSSLSGGRSGLFVYLQGQGVRQNVVDRIGLSPQSSVAEAMAFWDFAVMSVDFSEQQIDVFVAYPKEQSTLLTAMRSEGRIDASLLNRVPSALSIMAAADLGWLNDVGQSVAERVPEMGMMLSLLQGQLDSYGDLSEIFTGNVVAASDLVDIYGKVFRHGMEASADDERPDERSNGFEETSVLVAAPVQSVAAAHDLGLRLSPAGELTHPVSETRDGPPGKGEQRRYQTAFGPTLVLNGRESTLRLVYGPRGESLSEERSDGMGNHPMVDQALAWGDHSVVYLDYLNLQPLYAELLAVTQQESEKGDSEAVFFETLLRKWRPRLGPLEGVSCWKATQDGLHYRSHGLGSGPLLVALAVAAMTGSPSSAESPDDVLEDEL